MSSNTDEHPPSSLCGNADDSPDIPIAGSEESDSTRDSEDGELDEDNSASEEEEYPDSAVGEEPLDEDVDGPVTSSTSTESIPGIIEGLSSEEEDIINTSLEKLANIVTWEEKLAEEYIIPEMPKLIQVLKRMTDNTAVSLLLDPVCSLARISDNARARMTPYLQDVLPYLLNGDAMDRHNILQLLDCFAQEELSHSVIVDILRDCIYTTSVSLSPEQVTSAIETFENIIIYGRTVCRKIFLHAGVLNFLLHALESPSSVSRAAALSCFTQMVESADEIHHDMLEVNPSETSTKTTILNALLKCVSDEDDSVSEGAIQFFSTDDEDAKRLLANHPGATAALVLHIGRKTSDVAGIPAEWALVRLAEGESFMVVANAFRVAFSDVDVGIKIMGGLVSSFVDLRKAAMEGGLGERIVKWLNDEQYRLQILTALNKLMNDEQLIGFYLLKVDIVNPLVTILEGASVEECCVAASILAKLFDSYSGGDDSKPQREVAKAQISSADALSRIMTVLYSSHTQVSGAVSELLGELLLDEDGTESWSYDVDSGNPPPPSPLKDQIITPELLHHVIGLLKHPESAKGALYLLSQACWGNSRGLTLTEKAFVPYIQGADVNFFAALYGEYAGKHAGRQRTRVAEAAVKAGAIPRALELLESASGSSGIICTAVEGVRVLLTAESADKDIGRKSQSLPRALAMLVGDETKESLSEIYWMLRLIVDEDDNSDWLNAWTDFGTPESVFHLVNMLEKHRVKHEEPKEQDMSVEEYYAAMEEYQKKVSDSQEKYQGMTETVMNVLKLSLLVWKPHATKLIGPLLTCSHELTKDGELLDLIVELASTSPSSLDILVQRVKDIMEGPAPPAATRYDDWIAHSPTMATALYRAGVARRVMQIIVVPSEAEDINTNDRVSAICGLGKLVEQMDDESHVRAVQEMFFANQDVVTAALNILRGEDDYYSATRVAEGLYSLSKDFPSGVAALVEADIINVLLKLFDLETDDFYEQVWKLLGALIAYKDEEKVVSLFCSYFVALKGPLPEVPSAEKSGKKMRRNKQYKPRLNEAEVWLRITHLSATTDAARKAIVDAGTFEEAKFIIESDDTERWLFPLAFFEVVALNEMCAPFVVDLLPRMNEMLRNESAESVWPSILSVTNSLLPAHAVDIVSAGIHLSVLKGLGEYPASFEGISNLVDAICGIAGTPEGRPAVIQAMRDATGLENTSELELNWGYSHGFRRLVAQGEVGARVVVDAEGVEFAVKLLKSDDVHVVTKGAALCTTLVLSPSIEAKVSLLLEEYDVVELMDVGRRKALELTLEPYAVSAEEDEEDQKYQYTERRKRYTRFTGLLEQFVKVLGGHRKGYEEEFLIA